MLYNGCRDHDSRRKKVIPLEPTSYVRGDSNNDGRIDLLDSVFLLEYLFKGGSPIPAPFPNLWQDPTEDKLGCDDYVLKVEEDSDKESYSDLEAQF